MTYVALLLPTLLFVEAFIRLRVLEQAMVPAKFAQRSLRVIQAQQISDHWKERVLPIYSGRILLSTLRLLALLIIAFSPFIIAIVITEFLGILLAEELMSWRGILISTIAAIAYVFVRKRLAAG